MNDIQLDNLTAGVGVAMLLAFLFLGLCFISIFLHIGAGLMKIPGRTFMRSIIATVGSSIASAIFGGLAMLIHPLVGMAVYVLASVVVIKVIYDTGMLKAFGAWVLSIVVSTVFMVVLAFVVTMVAPEKLETSSSSDDEPAATQSETQSEPASEP